MRRTSTKEERLERAREFAGDWYLELRGKKQRGELLNEKSFRDATKQFEREYEVITDGERSLKWVEGHKACIRLHLLPFFGKLSLSQVTAGAVQDYRIHRMTEPETWDEARPWKAPARGTIHDEIITLRQIIKTALRHGWVSHLPDFTAPYRASGKVTHRAWFLPEEYRTLYCATRKNVT